MSKQDAAIVRGHADAAALKLACHDPAVHRRLVPGGQQARAVFDAVEQARVEAIGSRRMLGVKGNLSAMLDDKFHRGKFDEITDRADAPIEEAVSLMVRERLTGEAPPPAARKLVDLWRPFIEERAGKGLDHLGDVLEDQRKFGDAVHDLLEIARHGRGPLHLRGRGGRGRKRRSGPQEGRAGREGRGRGLRRPRQDEHGGGRGHRRRRRDRRGRDRCAGRRDGRRHRDGRQRAGCRAVAAARRPQRAARARLQAVHGALRRDDRRRGPLRARGTRPAARLSRQAALAFAGRRGAAGQPAAAPPDGAAEPRLGFRSRRGHARCVAADAHHHGPDASARLQDREGDELPRHRGDAAARQLRLDARPPDHGGGDLRRHPGAHAGALRRQGRDPRLHHPRLEGRLVARSLARRRQDAEPGPAQRPAPHHLQVGRRAMAARPQESRPDDARGPAEGEHRRRGARLGAQAPAGPLRAAQDF